MTIKVGRVYRYYPNGSKIDKMIVRVTRFSGCQYATIIGASRFDAQPYNFASFNHFGHATKQEIQEFVEKMPIR